MSLNEGLLVVTDQHLVDGGRAASGTNRDRIWLLGSERRVAMIHCERLITPGFGA